MAAVHAQVSKMKAFQEMPVASYATIICRRNYNSNYVLYDTQANNELWGTDMP